MEANSSARKAYRGMAMEGAIARRYAKLRASGDQLARWRQQAARWTESLPDGARILEVAPGPGYLAIEFARSGKFRVTGLDLSRTFVDLAEGNARQQGVTVEFRLGDAALMPFVDGTFDLVVCQAAFKNFGHPGTALDEMYRVLRSGGTAIIEDMRRDATDRSIHDEVASMRLGAWGAFWTRYILRRLRRRALTPGGFQRLAEGSRFHGASVSTTPMALEVRLTKPTYRVGA
ncbi:MAG TPA: class I SAM-dependent methyltransferase [Thermoplasmata archaeon]|nr:class I SAM-dependent methyltransferase [Thermoplasmata archaeon]